MYLRGEKWISSMNDALTKLESWGRFKKEQNKKRGQTMNKWLLRKADLCWPLRENAVSQWSRVKRGMKACEWVSAGVRVPCIPWAANLPVSPLSPPNQPVLFERLLLWLQSAYYNISANRVGVRLARWKYMQHKALSAPLLLTQCPLYELCWIKFEGKQ